MFERNLEDNIWELHKSLKNKTYKHSSYDSFFIQDPKVRHIHKASVRDRLLHHAIVRHLNPVFEPTFIHDSYSCRMDKGTHKGVEQFVSYARKMSKNFSRPCWVLKCDVKKFFPSIDQNILLDIVFKRVHDPDVRWLVKEVVESFRSNLTVDHSYPKGLPLGNITSQLFSNVYLNELDRFMKHVMKERYYVRYADDFLVLSPERQGCFSKIQPIGDFLETHLKLTLHPNKIVVRKFSQGVDFLGYVCFPNFRITRLKTEKRIFKKIRENAKLVKEEKLSWDSFNQSLQSYLGVLTHSNSYRLRQDLRNQVFFWLGR